MPDSGRGRLTPSKRKFLRAAAILQLAHYVDENPSLTAFKSYLSTFDRTRTIPEPLLTPGEQDLTYDIFMPAIEDKDDHAAIYVELSASMLLDNIDDREITVGRVLEDTEIGATPEIPVPKCQIVNQKIPAKR
jgi:hypothetical protein